MHAVETIHGKVVFHLLLRGKVVELYWACNANQLAYFMLARRNYIRSWKVLFTNLVIIVVVVQVLRFYRNPVIVSR